MNFERLANRLAQARDSNHAVELILREQRAYNAERLAEGQALLERISAEPPLTPLEALERAQARRRERVQQLMDQIEGRA